MKRLVLAGGGHAHLHVLRTIAAQKWAGIEVTLVSPHVRQIYSGMLPGWISGHYRIEECAAALKTLADAAGVRLVQDRVVGLDANRRIVRTESTGEFTYDVISVDTGAMVDASTLATTGATLLPIRPLEAFVTGWEHKLAEFRGAGSARLAVVGAGAAGVELALAARFRLAQLLGSDHADVFLVEGRGLMSGHGERVIRQVEHQLDAQGVTRIGGYVTGSPTGLMLEDGRELAVDCVIGTTGVIPAPWMNSSKLALAGDRFIAVGDGQRSTSHPQVFAAGDAASRVDHPHAKSGVYAVRAGPALSANLHRSLNGRAILPYAPQRRTLYLLAMGPKKAIVSWSGWSANGAWAWHWKDWIDRRFMKQYSVD